MGRTKSAPKAQATVKEPKKEEVLEQDAEVSTEPVETTQGVGDELVAETLEVEEDTRFEQIDAIFADLERSMLHGSTEQMNGQQNELLNAKVKIKRLF